MVQIVNLSGFLGLIIVSLLLVGATAKPRIVGWTTKETPANITFYWDIDGLNGWDIALNHPIMAQEQIKTCKGFKAETIGIYKTISTCPGDGSEMFKPVKYFYLREPSMWRFPRQAWGDNYKLACFIPACK